MTTTTQASLALVPLAVAMGAVLFVSAGTIDLWQAWLYLVVFVGASAFITADLARRDPELLQRRMNGGPAAENEPAQRVIMLLASLGFVVLLVVSALDHRLHWSLVPLHVVLGGDPLAVIGFYCIVLVYLVGTPLALGSYRGPIVFIAMVPVLIWRLLDEERLLARDLPGHKEYHAEEVSRGP